MVLILIAHCKKQNQNQPLKHNELINFGLGELKKSQHKMKKHPPPMASNQSYVSRMDFLFLFLNLKRWLGGYFNGIESLSALHQ